MILKINFTFQSGYIQMIDPSQVTVNDIVFTFQSGYIQMHMQKFVSNQVINFTFQSGYIQIRMVMICEELRLPLHSNLVIFKFTLFSWE